MFVQLVHMGALLLQLLAECLDPTPPLIHMQPSS